MPDYARHRPSERKPPRRASKPVRRQLERSALKRPPAKSLPSSGETRQVRSGGERPLALFRKLLQDFHNGVYALRGLSKSSPGTGLAPSAARSAPLLPKFTDFSQKDRPRRASGSLPSRRGLQISEQIPKLSRPLVRFKAPLGSMRESLPPAALSPAPPLPGNVARNVAANMSSRTVIGSHSLPASRARGNYHTRTLGADREAQQQILSGEYTGSVHHLPSAARLAQILRTESLIRAGEAQPNGMVFALAQAIREGRRREVADLNPEVVQGALFSSLGGATRAKQLLNSPITHGLITRHQIALEALQRDIRSVSQEGSQRARAGFLGGRSTRTRAGRARTERASRAPEFMAPSPALVSAAVHAHSGASTRNSFMPLGVGTEANLREMMTVNELPHLNEVAMNERERLQSSGTRSEFSPHERERLQSSGTRSEFSPHARQAPTPSRGMPHSPIGESGTRSPIAASIDAPKAQPHTSPQAQAGGNTRQAQRPQKLKGTLQLRGHNNQLLGVVELQDGEITNG